MKRVMRRAAGWLLVAVCLLCAPVAKAGQDALEADTAARLLMEGRVNRALLVGIDNFVSRPSAFPSSTNNVYAMRDALEGCLVPFESVVIPQEPICDGDTLTRLIREAFQDARETDVSYFYISTHGSYSPDSGEPAALLLSDGHDEGRITAPELEAAFEGIAGTKVLVLDACNSGAFIGKGESVRPESVCFLGADFKVLCSSGAMEESWYWSMNVNGGVQSVSAGDASERHARHERREQGSFYFTLALTQGLSAACGYPADGDQDGLITLRELYGYLLRNHAASTPQVYPQEDDFVVFAYGQSGADVAEAERAPVVDIDFSGTTLTADGAGLTLEYVALRPVRVGYQIVRYRDGHWQFGEATLLFDNVERFTAFGDEPGMVSPGRKVRTLALEGQEPGYVMVQLVSISSGSLTVHAGRVLCVLPQGEALGLSVQAESDYDLSQPRELSVYVAHSQPCVLSVAVVDEQGAVVRRVASRYATRPLRLTPEGSVFYWDGRDKSGKPVSPGVYRIRVSAMADAFTYTIVSDAIEVR